MEIDAVYHLCLEIGLRQVRIVTYRHRRTIFLVCPCSGQLQKAQGNPIDKFAPVDVVQFHEAEDISFWQKNGFERAEWLH